LTSSSAVESASATVDPDVHVINYSMKVFARHLTQEKGKWLVALAYRLVKAACAYCNVRMNCYRSTERLDAARSTRAP